MGQPMPDEPHKYGNDCLLKFDAGKTPKYLYARFSKIETCPLAPAIAPNDRTFTLTQHASIPCLWEHNGPIWLVSFEFILVSVLSRLWLKHIATGSEYFLQDEPGYIDEGFVFHNGYVACAGVRQGIKGLGVVTWTQQATELLEKINMQRAADLFMELRPRADGKLVYKFCRLQDATNISILFEP